MESIEPVWLFGAIALLAGVFVGMLAMRLFRPSSDDIDQLKSELEHERAEMARYKASVDSHFNKTSELVNELTQDYVKVYRHLAEGAQTLSDTREFTQVLEQPQGRVLITVDSETAAAEGEGHAASAERQSTRAVAENVDAVNQTRPGARLAGDDEPAGTTGVSTRKSDEPAAVSADASAVVAVSAGAAKADADEPVSGENGKKAVHAGNGAGDEAEAENLAALGPAVEAGKAESDSPKRA